MKFWVVAIAGANVPILGPLLARDHFWALRLKLHLLGRLCCFNGQILAEAEPGLIWTDQT